MKKIIAIASVLHKLWLRYRPQTKRSQVKDLSGKTIEPYGVYAHPMSTIGIQPLSIEDIMRPYEKQISEIVRLMGLRTLHKTYNDKKLIVEVLQNLAMYIHLLPASEDHHHCNPGGLLAHSIEVAVGALKHASSRLIQQIAYSDQEAIRRERYRYAVFIAAIMHDIGKVFCDLKVFDVDSGLQWQPRLESLAVWAKKNKINKYRVEWTHGRIHKKHESVSQYVMSHILTNEAKQYLIDCYTDDLFAEIERAITGYLENDGYIANAIRHGDSSSTAKAINVRVDPALGERNLSLAHHTLKSMKRHRKLWEVNEESGNVWVIHQEVYLTFPASIEAIIGELRSNKINCPQETQVMVNIMVDNAIIENPIGDSKVLFWRPGIFTEDEALQIQRGMIDGSAKGRWITLCRLKWRSYYFDDSILPDSAPGILSLNRQGYMILYQAGGKAPIEMPPPKATPTTPVVSDRPGPKEPAKSARALPGESGQPVSVPEPVPAQTTNTDAGEKGESTSDSAGNKNAAAGAPSSMPTENPEVSPKPSAAKNRSAPKPVRPAQKKPLVPALVAEQEADVGAQRETVNGWLDWVREQKDAGVMIYSVDQRKRAWLNVSKLANAIIMDELSVIKGLKESGAILECSRSIDPLKPEAWSMKTKAGVECLLAEAAVNRINGLTEEAIEVVNAGAEDAKLQSPPEPLNAQSTAAAPTEISASGLIAIVDVPVVTPDEGAAHLGSDFQEWTRVKQAFEKAQILKVERDDTDVMEREGGTVAVKVSWLKKAAGRGLGVSQDWINANQTIIDKKKYLQFYR